MSDNSSKQNSTESPDRSCLDCAYCYCYIFGSIKAMCGARMWSEVSLVESIESLKVVADLAKVCDRYDDHRANARLILTQQGRL